MITTLSKKHKIPAFEKYMVSGTKTNHSMAIIHHLANLEYMIDRVTTLQAKFISRSYHMPDDALFPTLLPHARQTKGLRSWTSVIRKNKIWNSLDAITQSDSNTVTTSDIKTAIKQYLKSTHLQRCQRKNSKLLKQCRQHLGIDPILWLPMTPIERNLCIYVLPPCDPISFVLNRLPKTPPTSHKKRVYLKIIWPKLCFILHQLHRTCRSDYYTTPSTPINQFGHSLIQWIEPPPEPHAPPLNL
ncbi:hypothetical protein INT45_001695 [Circinella minor]|uniref:Uncharacterized protein n=1 Tax=Circinella minor TaxID=1195481 RepID=A0A8H7VAD4_9FUNG|nr:hypothetical protein INT45_001695 [Circinella minor]